MNIFIGFILVLVGFIAGIIVTCLCSVSKKADDDIEKMIERTLREKL
jgi:hypothetical protein